MNDRIPELLRSIVNSMGPFVEDNTIDVGDAVYHSPTNETWLVAAVEGNRLYWCGWPFGGSAELSDCRLKRKATDEERYKLLVDLASKVGNERPRVLARDRLGK